MSKKFLTGIDLASQRIINLADPSGATDAANKQYVDNVAAGLNWKANVVAASTTNMAVATAVINAATMDGVTLATGDRVLLKNQTTASENGIYIVAASGAASRSSDADATAEVQNAVVRVAKGTIGADTMWQMVTDGITLGTTALTWTQFSAGVVYTQGNGISISGGVITAVANTGVTVTGSGIGVDFSIVPKKFAVSFGDGSATSYTITHNLGTLDCVVDIFENSSGIEVECDVTHATTNTLTLAFAVAPTSNQYRAVVHA